MQSKVFTEVADWVFESGCRLSPTTRCDLTLAMETVAGTSCLEQKNSFDLDFLMVVSNSLKSLDVVIPSYNSQETIERCLNGITKAIAHSKREGLCEAVHIYIVDDGSTDSSLVSIEHFIHTSVYPSTLIRQTQQGPSRARNSGTEHWNIVMAALCGQ